MTRPPSPPRGSCTTSAATGSTSTAAARAPPPSCCPTRSAGSPRPGRESPGPSHATTRVCAYDRAGQGWSEEAASPRDGIQSAEDLHTLLAEAGEHGPYVLVGHSTGGTYAMTYAARYPEQVAGMVLLDSSSPEQFTRMPAFPGQYQMMMRPWYSLLPTLSRLGLGQLLAGTSHLPAADAAKVDAITSAPKAYRNQRDEVSVIPEVFAQAQALTTLGDRPLAVLTASATATGTDGWVGAQDQLAALSTNSVHRTVDSTHEGLLEDVRPRSGVGPRHHRGRLLGPHRHAASLPLTRTPPPASTTTGKETPACGRSAGLATSCRPGADGTRTCPFDRGEHGPPSGEWACPRLSEMELTMTQLRIPSATGGRPRQSSVLRRIAHLVIAVALGTATLLAVLVGGVAKGMVVSSPPVAEGALPLSRPSSDGPIVVAVVLGRSGTDAADALAPYEVFARSGKFSVYTVAVSREPAPTNGGPYVVPTFDFVDITSGVARKPDLVVVPAVNDPSGEQESELRAWVVQQARTGARILGICAGSRVLAATGLLDGHHATSHWSRIAPLRKSNPNVTWVEGQRYVDDGTITTSAGVSSAIPAALHLVQELAGRAEAASIAKQVRYPGWAPDAPNEIPIQRFSRGDAGVGLNAVLPWFQPTLAVGLADGVGEIDTTALFDVYSYSSAARLIPVSTGSSITTAHGVVLLTTPAASFRPRASRLVLPGAHPTPRRRPRYACWPHDNTFRSHPSAKPTPPDSTPR